MNDSIENRLATLEKSFRRWRRGCLGMGVLAVIAFAAGVQKLQSAPPAAPAEILQARRIELIDAHGKPTIVLQSRDEGASLVVWGPDRQYAAVIVAQPKKAALMLMKGNDTPEVFAEAVDQGGQVGVTNGLAPGQVGTDRAALNMTGSPTNFGIFHVVNGQTQSLLSFSKTGGGLELRAPGSKAVTRVVGSEAGGHVQIIDRQGQVSWESPTGK
jgi:hypothetical protein